MTARRLEPKRTPLEYPGIINALLLAWEGTPTRSAVRLAAAQIAIESGLNSCMNFNISGIKAKQNGATCWQYFSTTEYYTPEQLKDAQAKAIPFPNSLKIIGQSGTKTKVTLYPDHPACCFRAFESLAEAMADHLAFLRLKFPEGLKGLIEGDAQKFAVGLTYGVHGAYFTAPLGEYVAGLKYRYAECLRKVPDSHLVWGDVT
jgi:hypothetical protein